MLEALLDHVGLALEGLGFNFLLLLVGWSDAVLLVFCFLVSQAFRDCLLVMMVLVDFDLVGMQLLL